MRPISARPICARHSPRRRRAALALLLCLWPLCGISLSGAALAEPLPALLAAPGDQALPGDPGWPLSRGTQSGVLVRVERDEIQRAADPDADDGLPGFRVELAPAPVPAAAKPAARPDAKPADLRACAGLASPVRRNLYKTRALEFRIKASRPLQGLVALSSTNTENPKARDRHFGTFTIGTQWKTLRLPYGSLAPLPGWAEEARRLGFEPGDLVLRPDSVEDICIGAEAGRLDGQPVTLWIGGVRFVR